MELPLELLRRVLAEAMLVRGTKRAPRLRPVNKLFASEVSYILLNDLPMLDGCKTELRRMQNIAVPYLTKRLLGKQQNISPRLERMRNIARRLSAEHGDDAESYSNNIKALCTLLAQCYSGRLHQPLTLWYFFYDSGEDSQQSALDKRMGRPVKSYEEAEPLEKDIIVAAAYLNNLFLVKELSHGLGELWRIHSNFGNPYEAATLGGSLAVLDYLLEKMNAQCPNNAWIWWWDQICLASRNADFRVVEHLISCAWKSPRPGDAGAVPLNRFTRGLFTPSLDMYSLLMNTRKDPDEDLRSLKRNRVPERLLRGAAGEGWLDMMKHLLELGAPAHSERTVIWETPTAPLFWACRSGSEEVVRFLLCHGAKITGNEMAEAAKRGHMGIVKALVECGADVNAGNREPIVSAVLLEYPEFFELLVEHGAEVTGTGCFAAVIKAEEDGLDSMLLLLEEHGIHVEGGVVKWSNIM